MAAEPEASRPHMPGYGTLPATEGTGLLPWSWAVERLEKSHDYWVATVDASGRPAVSPVWGAWIDDAVWFSCSPGSRKARNVAANPLCTVTTDNAYEPVIVEGRAVLDLTTVQVFTDVVNAKYNEAYTAEFFAENHLYRVRPETVLGLVEADFAGSPTRWRFNPPA
jgi:hypothetical protein